MKNKLIILDFDHTVFNTTLFVEALKKRFKEDFNLSEDIFMKYRNLVKDCCVVIDIDTFIEKLPLENKLGMHKAIEDVIRKGAKSWIFSDVVNFIKRHQENFDFLIVTHGDEELQREKITNSDLTNIPFVVSLDSKDKVIAPYIQQYEEVHFFDDKSKNIDAVKNTFSEVKTYFVKRPEDNPYGNKLSTCDCADLTVTSLEKIELN